MNKKRTEIEQILQKYNNTPKEKSTYEKIIALDKKVELPGKISALTTGIIGTIIFGTGMSLIMVFNEFFTGIIISLSGIIILSAAYNVYKKITTKRRCVFFAEIFKLSNELHSDLNTNKQVIF